MIRNLGKKTAVQKEASEAKKKERVNCEEPSGVEDDEE